MKYLTLYENFITDLFKKKITYSDIVDGGFYTYTMPKEPWSWFITQSKYPDVSGFEGVFHPYGKIILRRYEGKYAPVPDVLVKKDDGPYFEGYYITPEESYGEYIKFNFDFEEIKDIKKATPEEIEIYHEIETANKYNL